MARSSSGAGSSEGELAVGACGLAALEAMEDYEEDLYGVEDDFHNQFAAELEVLAELEGGCGSWVSARSWLHPPADVESCVDGIGSG